MLQICCECDWGLDTRLPPHVHFLHEWIELPDGRRLWMPGGTHRLNPDMTLLAEVSEISFSVDWKKLWREAVA